ncbi:hypothetical protein [Demequina sp. NBRC 110053]|uniref:hypothetical protein n=1 Tax=Demequina sp. NBRC 110053 TaxID=1570342 RepID=UPI0013565DFC|nr:hypothetical protein [Demequina sp. NBRC 110053]
MPDGHSPKRRPAASPRASVHGPAPALTPLPAEPYRHPSVPGAASTRIGPLP